MHWEQAPDPGGRVPSAKRRVPVEITWKGYEHRMIPAETTKKKGKMNMKKRVLTVLLALAMMVGLVACGGGGGGGTSEAKSAAGTYHLDSMKSGDEEITMKEMSEIMGSEIIVAMELKDDNSFTLDWGVLEAGDNVSGTWKLDGDALTLSAAGDSLDVTYDGKTIVLDVEGEILTFVKQ